MGRERLHSYSNGGFDVHIFSDGTKIRRAIAPSIPPFAPEQVDLKITDWCDGACPWCHEGSTIRGAHANAEWIDSITHRLPSGAEIAIGGGDPASHPDFALICKALRRRGLIPSVTVNGQHIARHRLILEKLIGEGALFGLGITVHKEAPPPLDYEHAVYHLIIGVHGPDFLSLLPKPCKILILGYKRFGRGRNYSQSAKVDIEAAAAQWVQALPRLLGEGYVISMDTLALQQLGFDNIRSSDAFMGEDGEFSMYVDAVRREYALSSFSNERFPLLGDICSAFQSIRRPPRQQSSIRLGVFETNSSSSHAVVLSGFKKDGADRLQIPQGPIVLEYRDFPSWESEIFDDPSSKAYYLMLQAAWLDMGHQEDSLKRAFDILRQFAEQDGDKSTLYYSPMDPLLSSALPNVDRILSIVHSVAQPVIVDVSFPGHVSEYNKIQSPNLFMASDEFFRKWIFSRTGLLDLNTSDGNPFSIAENDSIAFSCVGDEWFVSFRRSADGVAVSRNLYHAGLRSMPIYVRLEKRRVPPDSKEASLILAAAKASGIVWSDGFGILDWSLAPHPFYTKEECMMMLEFQPNKAESV